MNYDEFLASKAIIDKPTGIPSPRGISKSLFPFQFECVKWGLIRGRDAFFEGTGLGKTLQQSEWSRIVEVHAEKPSLIVAPLAVAHQTIADVKDKLGFDIRFAHSQDEVAKRGVYITNYQKLDKFDPNAFGGIALDESSILKSVDGSTKQKLIDDWKCVPFRSCWTATPAPNDYIELGNHAEFLGVMTATEMLSTFFVHDGGETQKWKLKSHAENDFWRWMASWSICISKPSDIGFDDTGYILPELRIHEVIVDCDSKPLEGELFAMPARTLQERRSARKVSLNDRVEKCAEIVSQFPDDQFLIWCNLNLEAESLAESCCAQNVTGSDSDEFKEKMLLGFASETVNRIVSKPSICGYGMNWQRCNKMAFVGLSDSFEQLYQAVRRCWRFGQKNPVDVYIIISSLEGEVLKNIKRKEADAVKMQQAMALQMADFTKAQLTKSQARTKLVYKPSVNFQPPSFICQK